MGLINGTGSITRYWVDGELPADFMEALPSKITRYAFRNLDENSTEEGSRGWVNILDILDNRFPEMNYLKEPYIAIAYREDKRKIPQTALKQYCREAEEKIKELEKVEFLSKAVRNDIKEDVRNRLLKRAIPVAKTYDMIWNINTGLVIFGGVNNKLCDAFSEYFLKTFDLHLKPAFPYSIACRLLEQDGTSPDVLEGSI